MEIDDVQKVVYNSNGMTNKQSSKNRLMRLEIDLVDVWMNPYIKLKKENWLQGWNDYSK